MNKEIKFRVWNKFAKDYIKNLEEEIVVFDLITFSWYVSKNRIYNLESYGLIIQEFTGLYDKDNKPIYKDDILKSTRPNYNEELYLVDYIYGGFKKRRLIDHYISNLSDSKDWLSLKIIGNICENPELLKS